MTGLASLALAFLVAGFAAFVRQAGRPTPLPASADGIVVLTGGAMRVEMGLILLQTHVADRMLISGVGDGVTLASLLEATRPTLRDHPATIAMLDRASSEGGLADRITLGHNAQTTVGNALEIAEWVRARRLRSLVVVTADYHMPRALAEIRTALPGAELHPCPVHPDAGMRVIALEYVKYLAVELGLAASPQPAEAS